MVRDRVQRGKRDSRAVHLPVVGGDSVQLVQETIHLRNARGGALSVGRHKVGGDLAAKAREDSRQLFGIAGEVVQDTQRPAEEAQRNPLPRMNLLQQ